MPVAVSCNTNHAGLQQERGRDAVCKIRVLPGDWGDVTQALTKEVCGWWLAGWVTGWLGAVEDGHVGGVIILNSSYI